MTDTRTPAGSSLLLDHSAAMETVFEQVSRVGSVQVQKSDVRIIAATKQSPRKAISEENLRGLKNVIYRGYIMADRLIGPGDLQSLALTNRGAGRKPSIFTANFLLKRAYKIASLVVL